MERRLEFQTMLEELLGKFPTPKVTVYFQAPTNTEMKFPCIVYEPDVPETRFAGNTPYIIPERYKVTVIDPKKNSPLANAVIKLPMCVKRAYYVANNLNHHVFDIHF